MKDINKIFETNKDLITQPEVVVLIDYCRELEGEILEVNINKRYSKEIILLEFLKEVLSIPSYTKREELVRNFLISFGIRNKIPVFVDVV